MKKLLTEWRKYLKEGHFKVDGTVINLARSFMNQPSQALALLDSLNNPEYTEGIGVAFKKVAKLLMEFDKAMEEKTMADNAKRIRKEIMYTIDGFSLPPIGLAKEVREMGRFLGDLTHVYYYWSEQLMTEQEFYNHPLYQGFKELIAGLE